MGSIFARKGPVDTVVVRMIELIYACSLNCYFLLFFISFSSGGITLVLNSSGSADQLF